MDTLRSPEYRGEGITSPDRPGGRCWWTGQLGGAWRRGWRRKIIRKCNGEPCLKVSVDKSDDRRKKRGKKMKKLFVTIIYCNNFMADRRRRKGRRKWKEEETENEKKKTRERKRKKKKTGSMYRSRFSDFLFFLYRWLTEEGWVDHIPYGTMSETNLRRGSWWSQWMRWMPQLREASGCFMTLPASWLVHEDLAPGLGQGLDARWGSKIDNTNNRSTVLMWCSKSVMF